MKKKIKIALIAPYPAQAVLRPEQIKVAHLNRPQHPAPWVRALTRAYAKREDITFRVFCHSRAVKCVQHGEQDGVPYTFIPKYEPARLGCYHMHVPARIQFRRHIKKYAPDLVHGFGMESAYGLIACEQGVPGVVFIQGIQSELTKYFDQRSSLDKRLRLALEKKVVAKASGLIAETDFAKKWAKGMRDSVDVAVIPHAVKQEFLKVEPTYTNNECLCIGTLSRIKAVDVSIRALSLAKNKQLTISVIGNGPLLADLKSLAKSLGMENRVKFYGFLNHDQIIEKMSKARMLSILSRMDTSPNILTEAHAAGLPVIGSRAGGIPDMIDDGKDGFLVDVEDAEAVAEKIDLLSGDVELCRRMGALGREKVLWLNDPDRIADEHIIFYKKLISN